MPQILEIDALIPEQESIVCELSDTQLADCPLTDAYALQEVIAEALLIDQEFNFSDVLNISALLIDGYVPILS